MNEIQLKQTYDLILSHKIEIANDLPTFTICEEKEPDVKASVYVWASRELNNTNGDLKTLYVGKAGYGITRRFSQHAGGFKNSVTGRKNKELLIDEINSGREILVYYRVSDVIEVFQQDVSRFSAEEDALCLALKPKWNRAGFPVVHNEDLSIKKELIQILDNDLKIFSEGERDEINNYLESISEETTKIFSDLIHYAHNYIAKTYSCKLVLKYSNQPKGCNSVPMVVYAKSFSEIGNAGKWITRITLTDKPRIIFPIDSFSGIKTNELIELSNDGKIFSPINTSDFVKNSERYIK